MIEASFGAVVRCLPAEFAGATEPNLPADEAGGCAMGREAGTMGALIVKQSYHLLFFLARGCLAIFFTGAPICQAISNMARIRLAKVPLSIITPS